MPEFQEAVERVIAGPERRSASSPSSEKEIVRPTMRQGTPIQMLPNVRTGSQD